MRSPSGTTPAIAADNPKATLPSTAITVVHRADGSGTTANFTAYLVKAAGTAWTLGTDKVVNWPTGQQAGTANAGVAQIVKDTDGAIGYVDYSDAKAAGLVFAAIKNASGQVRGRVARERHRGPRGCHGQRRPDLRPAERLGRRRVPDHRADLHPHLHGADATPTSRRRSRAS